MSGGADKQRKPSRPTTTDDGGENKERSSSTAIDQQFPTITIDAKEKQQNFISRSRLLSPIVENSSSSIVPKEFRDDLQPPPSTSPLTALKTTDAFFTGMDADGRRPTVRVRDTRNFQIKSLYRKRDSRSGLGSAVALLVGRDVSAPHEEKVIDVVFDTDKISEQDAREWWERNKTRFESPERKVEV